ncbi:MAG: NAD-dependent deacylase [Bryobacterales bacterium]|nr:NAD-dependent deacylase [Bryobacterales bacterium]
MEEARGWLRNAANVAALTGSGISAESGIPTFRGSGGLWRSYRAEDLATPEAFARHPLLVWQWYDWRRTLIAAAQPNPGHLALVELETRVPSFTLITQNVDGLHARAGNSRIVCLHGDIWTLRCTACGKEEQNLQAPLPSLPPKCACGAIQRPGVVWFGEPLPPHAWLAAEKASSQCDLFLVIGTSAVVMPAGGLVYLARQSGARVIEINSEETHLSSLVDCSLRGPAGTILPELLRP